MAVSAMAKIYFAQVTSEPQRRKLADVPAKWQGEVRQMLEDEGLDPSDY